MLTRVQNGRDDPYTARLRAFAATGMDRRAAVYTVLGHPWLGTPAARWAYLATHLAWDDDRAALRLWARMDAATT